MPEHLPATSASPSQGPSAVGREVRGHCCLDVPDGEPCNACPRLRDPRTGDPASGGPNLQNIPIRTEQGKAIRAAFTGDIEARAERAAARVDLSHPLSYGLVAAYIDLFKPVAVRVEYHFSRGKEVMDQYEFVVARTWQEALCIRPRHATFEQAEEELGRVAALGKLNIYRLTITAEVWPPQPFNTAKAASSKLPRGGRPGMGQGAPRPMENGRHAVQIPPAWLGLAHPPVGSEPFDSAEAEAMQPPRGPTPLATPDFTALVEMVKENIRLIAKDGHPGKDFQYYVFEMVLDAMYGPSIWDWYNKSNKGEG